MERAALLDPLPHALQHVIVAGPPCHAHRALMTLLLGFTQTKAHKAEILLHTVAVRTVNEFHRCGGPSWCSQGA